MTLLRMLLAGLVAALASCSLSSSPRLQSRILVDLQEQHQTIVGWEATADAGQDEPGAAPFAPRALDAAIELGITRLRLEIPSGTEHVRDIWAEQRDRRINDSEYRCMRYATVNDNDDPSVINAEGFRFARLDRHVETVVMPFKQRLEARGGRLHLNVNYVAFTKQICAGGTYAHDDPEEYAEFVLATSLHLREKFGLIADTWEVILEPDNTRSWSGRRIGEAIVASARRLRQHGFTTKFVAPSCTNMGRSVAYFDELIKVPGALEELAEISYHRYSGVSADNLAALAARATARGLRTAMLEKIGASYPELHADLKIGNASSWQQYTLAYPMKDNGAQYFTLTGAAGAFEVRPGSRTRYLAPYFMHVRPGARRIGASSDVGQHDPVAFRNADGRVVVIVKADAPGSLSVQGLPAGVYEVTYTTAEGMRSGVGVRAVGANQAYTADMPGAGVIAIVPTGQTLAPPSGVPEQES